jgi:hypothetical protein
MAIVDSRVRRGSLKIADADGTMVDFSCQPTAVRIVPSAEAGGGETLEVLCGDTASDAAGAQRGATMEISAISDFENPSGLVAFSWSGDGATRKIEWNPTGNADDLWEGSVVLRAIPVGGTVAERLVESITWTMESLKLPPRFGVTGDDAWWLGTGAVQPTGATAGTPGAFTPAGAAVPPDLNALKAITPPVVASPATAWTAGQGVALGTGSAHWDGSAWVAGDAS